MAGARSGEVKQRLKPKRPLTIPREFVLMDRAAIGLGAVMLHLKAEMNFHRLFAETIAGFDEAALAKRQDQALEAAGLDPGSAGESRRLDRDAVRDCRGARRFAIKRRSSHERSRGIREHG